ncbi:MAG TPA: O-antigen ligase family protein [Candidatus Limnocylindria bacterium]|jgi:hypothetical protein
MITPGVLRHPYVAKRDRSADTTAEGGGVPRAILMALFGGVAALEALTQDPLLDFGTYLFRGIGSWSGLPVIVSPLELLLSLGVIAALVSAAIRGGARATAALGVPVVLLCLGLLLGLTRGILAGGDMYVGFWEIRYLLYIPACYVIARLSLRRAEHVTALLRVGLLGATLFAIEGGYRRLVLIKAGALGTQVDFFFEHDDVVFLATFLTAAIATFVFHTRGRARAMAVAIAPVLAFTLLASNRRAGVIVLLIDLLIVGLVLLVANRKAFFLSMPPVAVAAALYLALFWNASGVVGQPARAVRSLYEPDARDAASNLYRAIENYDISETLRADPIFGVGFGREFRMVATLPDLSWWPFWRYETHNNVLWIWMKTGAAGYLFFWLLLGTAMARAASGTRRLRDPALRTAALVCLAGLVGAVVFGYVDLAFVSGRTTILVGTLLGIIAVVERLDRPASPPANASAVVPLSVTWRPERSR